METRTGNATTPEVLDSSFRANRKLSSHVRPAEALGYAMKGQLSSRTLRAAKPAPSPVYTSSPHFEYFIPGTAWVSRAIRAFELSKLSLTQPIYHLTNILIFTNARPLARSQRPRDNCIRPGPALQSLRDVSTRHGVRSWAQLTPLVPEGSGPE